MEQRSLIERLARHLAAAQPDEWAARIEDAASILAIIKEPDAAMRDAGDGPTWAAMIDAALRDRWSVAQCGPNVAANPHQGADEEGEFGLTADAVGGNRADWVHIHGTQEKKS